MAGTQITSGSKLPYVVTVTDDLERVQDFAGTVTGAVFDVYSGNAYSASSVRLVTSQAVAQILNVGNFSAQFICLVDTSTGGGTATPTVPVAGYWLPGPYSLYLRFTENPDSPRLGPNLIVVVA